MLTGLVRGEAANHGIEDAGRLVEAMERVVGGEVGLEEALAGYQVEVRERCRPSVLASRQACFDAFMVDQPVEGNPYVEMGSGPLDETRR